MRASDLNENLPLSHAKRVKTLSHRQCWRVSMKVELRGNSTRIPTAGVVASWLLRDVLRGPTKDDAQTMSYLQSLRTLLLQHWLQLARGDDESRHLKALSLMEPAHLLVCYMHRTMDRPDPFLDESVEMLLGVQSNSH